MPEPVSHPELRRRILLPGMDLPNLAGIEIGPLCDPLVRKADGPVTYVDHTSRETLVAKYTGDTNVRTEEIVDVDVVWGGESLADLIGTGVADYAIASHVAEHVPDLIGWLREMQAVLKSGGDLILVLPDKRMSLDCLRRETSLLEVLDAYVRKAKRPQPYQLLDCALGIVRSDAYLMHTGQAAPEDFPPIHTIDSALHLARHSLQFDEYIDIHCWSFTPRSFARLVGDMLKHGLVDFGCAWFLDTDAANNWEFFVRLRTGMPAEAAAASWRRMEQEAGLYIQGSAAAEKALRAAE